MFWVGTSGFQYPEWKGKFYPAELSAKKMLGFYSERFNSTESNYTFRRMPTEKILANWAAHTPTTFRFSLKAPQRITHYKKLRDCEPLVQEFATVSRALGDKRGAVLFQLEPSFKCDLPLLKEFLTVLPTGLQWSFEFRHESWFNDDVFGTLRGADTALCIADSEKLSTPVVFTAQHAYFRLRNEGYSAADLKRWAKAVRAATKSAEDIYVYFKHEERGVGPVFAAQIQKFLRD